MTRLATSDKYAIMLGYPLACTQLQGLMEIPGLRPNEQVEQRTDEGGREGTALSLMSV